MKTRSICTNLLNAAAIAIAIFITACQAPAEIMTAEQLRVFNDKIVQMWNNTNPALADELCNADYKRSSPAGTTNNLGEFKQHLAGVRSVWSNINLTINEAYLNGDKLITQWTWTATNTGPLAEGMLPATGKIVSINGISITRIKDGKMSDELAVWDNLDSNQQLGFTLAPPAAETTDEGDVE